MPRKILHVKRLQLNCTAPFLYLSGIESWICFFFSAVGNDFIIQFTVHRAADDVEVTSIIDLITLVYGKVMITDDSGIPQNLDVHLVEVTADTDVSPGGYEFALIEDGWEYSVGPF